MVVVSRRMVCLLLVVLALLSIAVRYPLVEHERNQTDSYSMHNMSQSIVDYGRAKWVFSSLSLIGYYPFSYPSGVPFLLAEVSSLTGLSVEVTILLVNFILGILFALGVFVLAQYFLRRQELVLLATFLSVFGSRFVDTSYWCGSARSLVVVLMILFVFTLLRTSRGGLNRLLPVAVLFGFGSLASHHMAVLLILFGVAYTISAGQIHFLYPRLRLHKRRAAAVCNGLIGATIAVVVFGNQNYYNTLGFGGHEATSFFHSDTPLLSVIVNLSASYTNQIGFVLLFAVFGIPGLLRRSRLSMETLFPLVLLLAFIPVLASTLYVSMLLAPFVAILGVGATSRMFTSTKKKGFAVLVVAVLMVSSIALPIWSVHRWNEREYRSGETVETNNQLFNDAFYLRENAAGASAITNVYVLRPQLAAVGHIRFLGSSMFATLSGDIRPENVKYGDITRTEEVFPRNLINLLKPKSSPDFDSYISQLMRSGVNNLGSFPDAKGYFSSHSRLLVAVDNTRPNQYVDSYYDPPAPFLTDIRNVTSWSGGNQEFSSYTMYQSEGMTLYLVQLPY